MNLDDLLADKPVEAALAAYKKEMSQPDSKGASMTDDEVKMMTKDQLNDEVKSLCRQFAELEIDHLQFFRGMRLLGFDKKEAVKAMTGTDLIDARLNTEFEEWAVDYVKGMDSRGAYTSPYTQIAWAAWKASAKATTRSVASRPAAGESAMREALEKIQNLDLYDEMGRTVFDLTDAVEIARAALQTAKERG
jgi:hypothetical protein